MQAVAAAIARGVSRADDDDLNGGSSSRCRRAPIVPPVGYAAPSFSAEGAYSAADTEVEAPKKDDKGDFKDDGILDGIQGSWAQDAEGLADNDGATFEEEEGEEDDEKVLEGLRKLHCRICPCRAPLQPSLEECWKSILWHSDLKARPGLKGTLEAAQFR